MTTLHAHVFEWYCEAIGLEDARKGVEGHTARMPRITGIHEVNYEGEADQYGGHRIVLTSTENGEHRLLKCPCGARVRRVQGAPLTIYLKGADKIRADIEAFDAAS